MKTLNKLINWALKLSWKKKIVLGLAIIFIASGLSNAIQGGPTKEWIESKPPKTEQKAKKTDKISNADKKKATQSDSKTVSSKKAVNATQENPTQENAVKIAESMKTNLIEFQKETHAISQNGITSESVANLTAIKNRVIATDQLIIKPSDLKRESDADIIKTQFYQTRTDLLDVLNYAIQLASDPSATIPANEANEMAQKAENVALTVKSCEGMANNEGNWK